MNDIDSQPPLPAAERSRSGGIFDEDIPSLADLVHFFARHWWVVAGCSAATSILVVLLYAVVLPERYDASATLVVVPPRFSSDLKPETLTVQGYQRLLESDAVIGETVRRLIEEGVLEEGQGLSLGEQLSSRIFVSRRSEATSLAPVIEAQGRARDPQMAATIANTWSAAFLDRLSDLISGSLLPSLDFITERYTVQLAEVDALEERRVTLADDFEKQRTEVLARWDRRREELSAEWEAKALAQRRETESLIATYQADTRGALQELAVELGLLETVKTLDQGGAAGTSSLRETVLQILTLRTHLAQTSPVLVLEKSISDDALWLSMAASGDFGSGQLPPVAGLGLRREETNPLFSDLSLRLSEAETRLDALTDGVAQRQGLTTSLARVEALQRERSGGLSSLRLERAAGLDEIRRRAVLGLEAARREREREVSDLERRRAAAMAELERELSHSQELFDELAANYNQASLARESEEVEDVRLASPAVPPLSPVPPRLMLKTVMACLVGAFLGLLLAVLREVEGAGIGVRSGGDTTVAT